MIFSVVYDLGFGFKIIKPTLEILILVATKNGFLIVVIPHTLRLTNLKYIKKNDILNVEIDIFAKYIKNLK